MAVFNLKVLTNDGSGTYLNIDLVPSTGEVPTVTSNGMSGLSQDVLYSVGEGATYADNTLTLPITILGFATAANKTTADYAVGATITLPSGSTTIYAVPSTSRLSVDVSTLAGWANLSAGSHDITIVAKAAGYKDSAPSASVKVTKAASTKTLKAGTYKWKDVPTLQLFNETIAFTSGGSNWTGLTVNPNKVGQILYIGTQGEHIAYGALGWGDESDKTITLATDQQVSADFYEWAITGGNLVKQPTGETWVLKESSPKWGTHSFTTNFTSNNEKFTNIQTHFPALGDEYFIGYFAINEFTPVLTGAGEWTNQAYRTLTFETAPTGDLLTWLQANGTKQS